MTHPSSTTISPLFHHASCIVTIQTPLHHPQQESQQQDLSPSSQTTSCLDKIVFLSGGESPHTTWNDTIYAYPLMVPQMPSPKDTEDSEELPTLGLKSLLFSLQNPSKHCRKIPFLSSSSSPSLPPMDSHSMIVWPSSRDNVCRLVFLAGNVGALGSNASDVYVLEFNTQQSWSLESWKFTTTPQQDKTGNDLAADNLTSNTFPSEHHQCVRCISKQFFTHSPMPKIKRRLQTVTYIGNDELLLVGGIAIDSLASPFGEASSPHEADSSSPSHGTDVSPFGSTHTVLKDAWIFNLEKREWKQVAPPPEYLFGHSAIYDDQAQCVLVFGGTNHANERLNDLHVYYPHKNLWKKVTNAKGAIPTPREQHTACFHSVNRQMIIYGGWTGAGPRSDCFAYDVDKLMWYRVAVSGEKKRSPRYGHTAECVDSHIVVYGGRNDYFQTLDTFELIEPWDDTESVESNYMEGELTKQIRMIPTGRLTSPTVERDASEQEGESTEQETHDLQASKPPPPPHIDTAPPSRLRFSGADVASPTAQKRDSLSDSPLSSNQYSSPQLDSPSSRFQQQRRRSVQGFGHAGGEEIEGGSQDGSPASNDDQTAQAGFAHLLESIVSEKESEGVQGGDVGDEARPSKNKTVSFSKESVDDEHRKR